MRKRKFTPRTFIETLELLCFARRGDLVRHEKINQTAISSLSGISQATISRWINGRQEPKLEEIRKIADIFGITTSQMIGETPIERLDSLNNFSEEDEIFLKLYKEMPEKLRHYIRENAKETLELLQSKEQ